MHNGIEIPKVKLSTGEIYTPEKGKPPAYPCYSCKEVEVCNRRYYVCSAYMDYERMKFAYGRTIFD